MTWSTAYTPGNTLTTGSTRSGKSYGEVHKVIAAAQDGNVAVVVVDPHPRSLAAKCFEMLVAHGLEHRLLYDQIPNLEIVLGYRFLRPSTARNPLRQSSENDQTVREFIDVALRRREQESLATSPLTEDYVLYAGKLLIAQRHERPASDMAYAFRPKHPTFERLLDGCLDPEATAVGAEIASGAIKAGQYAAARRLLDGVCRAPAFQIRCGRRFDLHDFLDRRGILLVEGGTRGVSEDAVRTILGGVILQTINYIRSRPRPYPRVLLVLDEATNAGLLGAAGHEARALAELQKSGLDCHVLVQSPNFPNSYVTDAVFSNCVRHEWYFAASDDVARKAASDLGSPEYRERVRALRTGERLVKDRNRVFHETVPQLDDPWVFPGLSEAKAKDALARIQQRCEYERPTWTPPEIPIRSSGTKRSSSGPPTTSASPTTLPRSSPAQRLATGGSPSSAPANNSAASGSSS